MAVEFEIYKKRYPMPSRYRLGDPVLVREITGMEWPEFIEALNQMEVNEDVDQVAMLGVMAVAFWQGNQDMSRDKVRRTLERVWQEDAELVSDGEEEDTESPPAEAGVTPASQPTSSNGSADAGSDETSPTVSGSPGSPTGSPESFPA